jgi:hypothetical protein
MKIKVFAGFVLLALILFMYSCENNQVPVPSGQLPAGCDTAKLTYSSGGNSMQVVINTYCAINGCHASGGAEPDYTSYANLNRYATGGQNSAFWQYLFVNKTMPQSPQPPLDVCTQFKFKAWLMANAPQ